MPDLSLTTFYQQVASAGSTGELWHICIDFLKPRGICQLSYHVKTNAQLDSESAVLTYGFPKDWVEHYLSNHLMDIDPITALSVRRTQPFLWREVPFLTELTASERSFLRELETANLGNGLAMQVYGPNMRNAYVGMGLGNRADPPNSAEIFELKAAAQIAHLRYCELTEERMALERDLSPREREVLNWIARGKSNGVIAEIVGVSRHTVDTLVRRLFEKLDAADRTTAALNGLGYGLIRTDRAPNLG
ncbi:hypothetical protein JANAI62_28760 [Jannaschia pagri]|uniref:HTH luxR-type domain-containing protein n=1 Tax=Jannaschia pagri TaxID=2829797 RepID=A0ABQ4NPB3_9RHOB|nr:LuxR family transcriptional regulator [Jannaschia sp. AI_62]GIT92418.1 hypothetical protein JANAI61_28760 [Jannaschia sp. AI_61]GIT96253.1 hypothetical protein JANAI62_28760 [Jannaschia sp. AI_62]